MRKGTTRHVATTQQIIDVYALTNAGWKRKKIAKKLRLPHNDTVHNILMTLEKYLSGDRSNLIYARKAYLTAAKTIKGTAVERDVPVVSNGAATPPRSEDRYELMKQAYTAFEQSLSSFIEAEVAEKGADLIKENQELQNTVTRLQQENTYMQEVYAEAKNSNWVDHLKKKFEQSAA